MRQNRGTLHRTVPMRTIIVICLLFELFPLVRGQNPQPIEKVIPPISKGLLEIGVFPGFTTGGEALRPMVGATTSFQISKYFAPYLEGSWFPSLDRSFSRGDRLVLQGAPTALDFHGGTHILIRRRRARLVSYGSFGMGYFAYRDSIGEAFDRLNPSVRISQPLTKESAFTLNTGGGVRWYSKSRWGIRTEVKYYRTFGLASESNVVKVTIGPFFHLRLR